MKVVASFARKNITT